MAKTQKRTMMSKSSDYYTDQLDDLLTIANNMKKRDVPGKKSRAALLREGADTVIKKYSKYLNK